MTGADATRPYIEAMLMMLPPPRSSIERAAIWLRTNTALRLTSMTCRKWSRGSSSAGYARPMPALLTTTSTRPKRSSVNAMSLSRSSSTLTSHVTVARPSTSAASRSSRSARRAAPMTWAPAAESTRAKRSPSPLEAPVTTATRPSRPKIPAGLMTSWVIGLLDTFEPSPWFRLPSALHEAEKVPRHVADLDLLGALRDPVAAVVAVDVLERLVAGVADAAVDLHRAVGGLAHQPVGAEVAHRHPVADARHTASGIVHLAGGLADEGPQQLDVGGQLDQRPLDRLALGQRLAERHALARVLDALAHAVVRRSHAGRGLADPVLVDEEQRRRQAAALHAEDRVVGDADVLELDLGGRSPCGA